MDSGMSLNCKDFSVNKWKSDVGILFKKAECEGLLRGVEIGRGGVVLSLLQFADDTVFIGMADAENVRVVKAILLCRRKSGEEKVLEVGARSVSSEACHLEKPTTVLWRLDYLNKLGDGLDSLWKRVIWGKYYGRRRERDATSVECLNMSQIWKDIMSLGSRSERLLKMLIRGFKWEVGDGSCVDFWSDKWVGDKSLKELYPRLFVLAIRTEGILKDMGVWCGVNWVWDCRWRCGCRGRAVEEEEHFRAMINGFKLRIDREDSWKWVHSSDGCYSVKAAYEFLTPNSSFFEEKWAKVIWNRYVPSKVNVFGWRMFLNRLATIDNLCKRGIVLSGSDMGPRECREAIVQHRKNLKSAKKLQREAIWKSADQDR
ncbi:hypothetical protein SLEP1_g20790 [Rubroshorea leprosula]|uniref:Reverse transcriptase zinc-binding domain-containing protein n=1 Tax=Rubroshorea leprosula TaxID=152421 RepID=A0AAV5JFS6_9ROSI|nr:hypothetical protein SLEP1_g20790 [Rubroshorea leprosula]